MKKVSIWCRMMSALLALIMVLGMVPVLPAVAAEADPANDIVVDLHELANSGKDLSTCGVTGSNVTDAGWGLNTDETIPLKNPTQTFKWHFCKANLASTPVMEDGSYAGVYMYSVPSQSAFETGFTFNVYVPQDGYYRPEITAVGNTRCGGAEVKVDGVAVGEYYGHAASDAAVLNTHSMNTVYLTEGVHKINLHGTKVSLTYANYYWIYLNNITLVKQDGPQRAEKIDLTYYSDQLYAGNSTAFAVEAFDADGNAIYVAENSAASFDVKISDPSVLKAENGQFYGLKAGTVTVTVTVSLPGSEKSVDFTVEVLPVPDKVVIDLHALANSGKDLSTCGVTGSNVTDAGWGLNTDETIPLKNPGQTFKWHFSKANLASTPAMEDGSIPGVYMFNNTSSVGFETGYTFNVYVPADGYYRPDVTAVGNTRCGGAEVKVDGVPVGEYYGYATTDTMVLTTHSMNTVYLTKGVHKVNLHSTKVSGKFANYYWIYLNNITLVRQEGPQKVGEAELSVHRQALTVGKSSSFAVKIADAEGRAIHFGEGYGASWSVESGDPSVLKVENGRIYGLKAGKAVLTLYVRLPEDEKSVEIEVEVLPEATEAVEFELAFHEDVRDGREVPQYSLEDDDWELASDHTGVWLSSWEQEKQIAGKYLGIVYKRMHNYTHMMEFDFVAPADGLYRIDLNHVVMSNCGQTNVYFEGEFIGTYNGGYYHFENSGSKNWDVKTKTLTRVELKKGEVYRISFDSLLEGKESTYTMLNSIRFVPDADWTEPEVDRLFLSLGRSSMVVGESCSYSFTALDKDNNKLPIGAPMEGFTSKYYTVSVSDPSVIAMDGNQLTALKPGKAELTVTVNYGGVTKSATRTVEVSTEVLDRVTLYLSEDKPEVGETVKLGVNALTDTGRKLSAQNLQITYASSNEAVATVDAAGNVTAVGAGTTELTAQISLGGVTVSGAYTLEVEGKQVQITVSSPDGMTMRPDDADGIELILTGQDAEENAIDFTGATVVYVPEKEGIAEFKDGRAYPIARGDTTVHVTITMPDGTVYETITWISVNAGKVSSTYYTQEKRNAAVYNSLNYDWAFELRRSATEKADVVIKNLDLYYDMITFEGLPRAEGTAVREDPLGYYCPMCEKDIVALFGAYPWIYDPINDPWKIKCPVCQSRFPSNDFESYYKSGLDAQGVFHEENADEQYLVNELYPEKGSGWGVDSGWGWNTGETYTNLSGGQSPRIYAFIPCYIGQAIWGGYNSGVRSALRCLTDAYLYTGDIKYGRAGAILIDRIADAYPSFDLMECVFGIPRTQAKARSYISELPEGAIPYTIGDGYYYQGGVLGCISESNFFSKELLKAYDAFFPAFDDPEVIAYLSARAEEQGRVVDGENPKDTPQELRQNGIDGLIHKMSEGVRNRDIWGNFGLPQGTMALCAIILDSTEQLSEPAEEPPINHPTQERRKLNTTEMMAWLFEDGVHAQKNTLNKILEDISRDGHGMEVSPSYHKSWVQGLMEFAEATNGYTGYPGADLYKNPKFIKMVAGSLALTAGGNTTLQNGDTGVCGGVEIILDQSAILKAYEATGNVELAQALYFLNGEKVDGLHGSIFNPNAGKLTNEILHVIEEHGAYDVNKSIMLSGYGQFLLRDGTKLEKNQSLYSLWFGMIGGHGRRNALGINIFAYGLGVALPLGYPQMATNNPLHNNWNRGTISQNTVVIDDESQVNTDNYPEQRFKNDTPLHFDDVGRVKVADADGAKAYPNVADVYRRTLVTVQGDDDAHYAVDFFHVVGGSTHLYSFNAAAKEFPVSDKLDFVVQEGGSYAGADVPYEDPNMANGYSFLYDVRKDENPEQNFYLDYTIVDHRHTLDDPFGIHLRLNVLSTEEEPITEVSLAKGPMPLKPGNPEYFPYSLIRKDGGNNLFTTVIEPYRFERYLDHMELVDVVVKEGDMKADDRAAAVKVYRTDGKVEYIVYCTNYDAVLRVDDRFDFSGFVGVVTYMSDDKNAATCYRYGMEATIVAGPLQKEAAINGTVEDFTRELVSDSTLTIRTQQNVDPEELVGRAIFVDNDGTENGAYTIMGAEADGDTIVLDLADQSLIRGLKDPADTTGGYRYNIAVGQNFTIPMSAYDDTSVFAFVGDQVIKAGNKLNLTTGVAGSGVSYEAEGLVAGMKLDAKTGTLTWTTSKTNVGRYPITIYAVRDGDVIGTMSFVVYVVSYTGSTYAPDKCSHNKAVDFGTEIVCPACGTITKVETEPECDHTTIVDEDKDTKCDHCGEVVYEIKPVNITSANMTLGNELKLNFIVKKSDVGSETYTAKIYQDGKETMEVELAEYNATYMFATRGVAAKEMTDQLSIELYDANGYLVSEPYSKSIKDYADAMMARTTNAKLKTLLVDMLNYGTEAQNYFGYNTDNLANADLTEEQQGFATGSVEVNDYRVKGTNYAGTVLSLEDSILLGAVFNGITNSDVTGLTATVEFTNYRGNTISGDCAVTAHTATRARVTVNQIVLADSRSVVTVKLYKNGELVGECRDSVESYAARSLAAGQSTVKLNDAIMKFSTSAKAYLS